MLKRVINVGGESLGLRFTKEECKLYGIIEGDVIDLSDMFVVEKLNNKKKNGKKMPRVSK